MGSVQSDPFRKIPSSGYLTEVRFPTLPRKERDKRRAATEVVVAGRPPQYSRSLSTVVTFGNRFRPWFEFQLRIHATEQPIEDFLHFRARTSLRSLDETFP
jgi:hypothetical protein